MKPILNPLSKAGRLVIRYSVLLLVVLAFSASATQLKSQNLTDLINQSQSIIVGQVTSVTDGFSEKGTPYTEVTIKISSAIKGRQKNDSEYTFRQFGLLAPKTMPNGKKYMLVSPQGFPSWAEGETVMAFMHKPASRTGLQTTTGLAQGKISLNNGRAYNQFDNFGLFKDVEINSELLSPAEASMLTDVGAVDSTLLTNLVSRAVRNGWIEKGDMK